MLEMFDKELPNSVKDKLKINQKWLHYQRNKLMGAIDQIESRKESIFPFRMIFFKLQEIPLSLAIFGIFALLLGFSAGIIVNSSFRMPSDEYTRSIMDMLSSNKISSVQLDIDPTRSKPYVFRFISKDDYQYSGNENDETVILLLDHMLNNTSNPGDRLKLARKLSDSGVSSEMAVSVIVKAMLSENNSAIQSVLIESLKHNKSSIVRDALLRIVMGDYDVPIRLSALDYLTHFTSDPYVSQILKVISLSDENPSIRYTADKLLLSSNNLSDSSGEIKK